MKTKWPFKMTLVLLIGFTAVHVQAAQEVTANGAIKEANQQTEFIKYGDFKAGFSRDVYDVPQDFGALVSITPMPGTGVIFWFQDDQGFLRNVDLPDVTKPLVIRRQGTLTIVQ